ncbi:MAG: ABC transporter substrate-binding protein, partial [Planctomycetota bacterium]
MAWLFTGQIDIGTSTCIDLPTIRANCPREPLAFYSFDFSNGTDVIIANPDITSFEDLRGRTIAAETDSLDRVLLFGALEHFKMSADDVSIVSLPQLDMHDGLLNGTIDAAVCYPPESLRILKREGTHIVFDSSMAP